MRSCIECQPCSTRHRAIVVAIECPHSGKHAFAGNVRTAHDCVAFITVALLRLVCEVRPRKTCARIMSMPHSEVIHRSVIEFTNRPSSCSTKEKISGLSKLLCKTVSTLRCMVGCTVKSNTVWSVFATCPNLFVLLVSPARVHRLAVDIVCACRYTKKQFAAVPNHVGSCSVSDPRHRPDVLQSLRWAQDPLPSLFPPINRNSKPYRDVHARVCGLLMS